MTRLELANAIAAKVNGEDGFAAKVWAKAGNVRVYVNVEKGSSRKPRMEECGSIEIGFDGVAVVPLSIEHAARYTKPLLAYLAALPAAEAEAAPERVAPAAPARKDEDEEQFERSERKTAADESRREQG